jgi:hypothetical protein
MKWTTLAQPGIPYVRTHQIIGYSQPLWPGWRLSSRVELPRKRSCLTSDAQQPAPPPHGRYRCAQCGTARGHFIPRGSNPRQPAPLPLLMSGDLVLADFYQDPVMRSPDWSQGSHRTATGIALPALTLVAGCSSGPTDAQLFAADRAATALRAQVWAEYLAAARAARQVRVDGGFPDLGVPTGGSLYPCPSPITAPIWPQPGEYSPRQEYAITAHAARRNRSGRRPGDTAAGGHLRPGAGLEARGLRPLQPRFQ